jgi:TetR/AcrR family transcriptional repressor of nem operon
MAGRPREFDETDVLEEAMLLFWWQGYESTSLSELIEHMSISRQSLYNTFGGKQQLFHRVLEHYQQTRVAGVFQMLEAADADLHTIEEYFANVATYSTMPGEVRVGCLMVNTTVELANQEGDAATAVRRFGTRLEKALLHALRGARKAGQLAEQPDPKAMAQYLMTVVQGMLVVSKAGASRKQLQSTAQLALASVRAVSS